MWGAGHSMGGSLAAYAIGTFSDRVETAIFMDPVDFSFLDDRVSQKFLTK
jgi:pimeloyl-ACP methyl ester carboxylesterase